MRQDSGQSPKQMRRPVKGLVVSQQAQFKMAVTCSSLLLVPTLIAALTFIADLVTEARAMADSGLGGNEIASVLRDLGFTYAIIVAGLFVICAAISIFASLRLSNGMIGPVARLEAQLDRMLEGQFEAIPPMRKNDYLKSLGEKVNRLATKLGPGAP